VEDEGTQILALSPNPSSPSSTTPRRRRPCSPWMSQLSTQAIERVRKLSKTVEGLSKLPSEVQAQSQRLDRIFKSQEELANACDDHDQRFTAIEVELRRQNKSMNDLHSLGERLEALENHASSQQRTFGSIRERLEALENVASAPVVPAASFREPASNESQLLGLTQLQVRLDSLAEVQQGHFDTLCEQGMNDLHSLRERLEALENHVASAPVVPAASFRESASSESQSLALTQLQVRLDALAEVQQGHFDTLCARLDGAEDLQGDSGSMTVQGHTARLEVVEAALRDLASSPMAGQETDDWRRDFAERVEASLTDLSSRQMTGEQHVASDWETRLSLAEAKIAKITDDVLCLLQSCEKGEQNMSALEQVGQKTSGVTEVVDASSGWMRGCLDKQLRELRTGLAVINKDIMPKTISNEKQIADLWTELKQHQEQLDEHQEQLDVSEDPPTMSNALTLSPGEPDDTSKRHSLETCWASLENNPQAVLPAGLTLPVDDKPPAAPSTPRLEDAKGQQLKISWSIPDATPPVTDTGVQIRVVGEPWQVLDTSDYRNVLISEGGQAVAAPMCTIVTSRISPNKTYEAMVQMKNAAGWSPISSISNAITVEEASALRRSEEAPVVASSSLGTGLRTVTQARPSVVIRQVIQTPCVRILRDMLTLPRLFSCVLLIFLGIVFFW